MTRELVVGFLPLVDAALPILAHEHGFAEEEGLSLRFVRDVSWATVLDRLLYGHSDVAHLIAPLAIATTLGRGRPARQLAAPFILGLNGNAITMTPDLASEIAPSDGLVDPAEAGARLRSRIAGGGRRLRFGVVHRYSSHNYKLRYWLAESGIRPDHDVEIVTVAPPFAADAMAEGEVDAICVGEPWNSVAVHRGVGRIVMVTSQIWRRGVEKVLALPADRLDERREDIEALIRAIYRAAQHFVLPENWDRNSEILSRNEYLGADAVLIRHAISDRLVLRSGAPQLHVPDFMFQYREAANFPWVSQAAWLYSQLVRWDRLEFSAAALAQAQAVFRPDIYRSALAKANAPMPAANSKVEGGVDESAVVGTVSGRLTLSNDLFFDRKAFDPERVEEYLKRLPS